MKLHIPDCRLTFEVKDSEVAVRTEHLTVRGLASICGALQTITGGQAVGGGMSLDEVKTHMLDIHLEAMEALTVQIINESGER